MIEKHFWSIQKSRLDEVAKFKELASSVDIILDSVKKNEKVYNDLTKYLFQYFEKYSLFNASEYIALKALSQKEVALNSALVNKLESYRKMKVGNRAPNFELLGDVFKNGTAVKAAIHLSDIKTKYKNMNITKISSLTGIEHTLNINITQDFYCWYIRIFNILC